MTSKVGEGLSGTGNVVSKVIYAPKTAYDKVVDNGYRVRESYQDGTINKGLNTVKDSALSLTGKAATTLVSTGFSLVVSCFDGTIKDKPKQIA